MKTFLTADLHFSHRNIIRFCKRPFTDVNQMDQVLVNNWNDVVQPDDLVYVVGDFQFHPDPDRYLPRS